MKNLDIMARPTGPENRKTIFGGIVTIFVILLTFYVIFIEYQTFKDLRINKTLYMDPNPV